MPHCLAGLASGLAKRNVTPDWRDEKQRERVAWFLRRLVLTLRSSSAPQQADKPAIT